MSSQPDITTVFVLALVGLGVFFFMVRPALDSRRWQMAMELSPGALLTGLLSVGLIAYLMGPRIAISLTIAVAVHEYGHVLAYRLAGKRAPRFRLVPFGGVAMSDEPPRSQAENAYVALMGPGFSLILVAVAIALSEYLRGEATWGALLHDGARLTASQEYAIYLRETAILAGALNAFNLLPAFPLDGGRALHAIFLTAGAKFAGSVSITLSMLLVALAFFAKLWFLLFFAVMGVLIALQQGGAREACPAMSARQAILAMAAYLAVAAAHGVAGAPFIFGLLSRWAPSLG